MEKERLMTMEQAAEYAGVDPSTVRRAARLGLLQTIKAGKLIRLTTPEYVDAWKAADVHKPGPKPKGA